MYSQWAASIISIGAAGRDEETARRVKTINFTSVAVIVILFTYNSFYILWGDASLLPLIRIVFFCNLGFAVPILLNQKQKVDLAAMWLTVIGWFAVVMPTVYLGTGSGIHFFLIVMIALSVLISRRDQLLLNIFYVATAAGLITLCDLRFEEGMIHPFPPMVMDIILANSILGSAIMTAGILAYYRNIVFSAEAKAREAHEQTRNILNSILPHTIAHKLEMQPDQIIAEEFDSLTVLFADIVSFTSRSKDLTPEEVVLRLDRVFSTFDELAEKHGLEKIKTIGDCYMLVGGAPDKFGGHADRVVQMGIDMQAASEDFSKSVWPGFQIRVGIHSGSAVAGVIGQSKFAYDVWGDTVNIASRLEEACAPDEILISGQTRDMVLENFNIGDKVELDLKGRGTYEAWKVAT